jgi:hypothetical protein
MKRFFCIVGAGTLIVAAVAIGLSQVPSSFLRSNLVVGTAGATSAALTLIDTKIASNSAELDFTSDITSTYDVYEITIQSLIPASGGLPPIFQVSTNNGSTYDTTSGHYQWGYTFGNMNAGNGTEGSASDAAVVMGLGQLETTTAWGGLNGTFWIYDPLNAASYKHFGFQMSTKDTRDGQGTDRAGAGIYVQTAAINAFRILMGGAGANLTSGIVRVYGLGK